MQTICRKQGRKTQLTSHFDKFIMDTNLIEWKDFAKLEIRVGTVVRTEVFKEARNPAYKIWVDFGEKLGIKKTSAQITDLYSHEELIGKQILGITNFPPKQIGPFMSEFLLTGFADQENRIIIATTDKPAPNGTRLK